MFQVASRSPACFVSARPWGRFDPCERVDTVPCVRPGRDQNAEAKVRTAGGSPRAACECVIVIYIPANLGEQQSPNKTMSYARGSEGRGMPNCGEGAPA